MRRRVSMAVVISMLVPSSRSIVFDLVESLATPFSEQPVSLSESRGTLQPSRAKSWT